MAGVAEPKDSFFVRFTTAKVGLNALVRETLTPPPETGMSTLKVSPSPVFAAADQEVDWLSPSGRSEAFSVKVQVSPTSTPEMVCSTPAWRSNVPDTPLVHR